MTSARQWASSTTGQRVAQHRNGPGTTRPVASARRPWGIGQWPAASKPRPSGYGSTPAARTSIAGGHNSSALGRTGVRVRPEARPAASAASCSVGWRARRRPRRARSCSPTARSSAPFQSNAPNEFGARFAGGFYLYTSRPDQRRSVGGQWQLLGVAVGRERQGELPRRRRRGTAGQAGAHPDPRVELQGPGHRHPPHGPDRAGLPRRVRPRRLSAADQHHRRRRRRPGRRPGPRGAHTGTP